MVVDQIQPLELQPNPTLFSDTPQEEPRRSQALPDKKVENYGGLLGAPMKLVTAGASLSKRIMLAVTISPVAGSSQVLYTHSGLDRLLVAPHSPLLPQEEDALYGRIITGAELKKLKDFTALDRLTEHPDFTVPEG